MSGGGSQTSTSVQQADPRIWSAVEQNMGRARGIADQPFEAYGGQMTAGLAGNQNQAINMAPGLFNAGAAPTNQAVAGASGLLNYNAQNPANVAGGMAAYRNPYEDQVVHGTLSDIERQRQMQMMSDKDSAIAADAFGGTREGVQRSLTNDAYDRNAFNAVSGLRSQGFNTAAGLAQQDASRGLQADLGSAGVRSNASGLLGQLGAQQQQMYGQGLSGLLQTGGVQQGNQQQDLDAQFQEFLRRQQYPYQGQQLINQSLGLLPQNTSTTTTGPKQNQLGGVGALLGGVGSILGIPGLF